MPSKYSPLPNLSPRESEEDATGSLLGEKTVLKTQSWYPTLRWSLLTTAGLVIYSLAICWVTKLAVVGPHHHQPFAPASSCKSPNTNTSANGNVRLTFAKFLIPMRRSTSSQRPASMVIPGSGISSTANRVPRSTRPGLICSSVCVTLRSPTHGWTVRLTQAHTAFNTRVPAARYEASMNNRSSARVADGSENPDYYVTLTVYHELHCLVSCSV